MYIIDVMNTLDARGLIALIRLRIDGLEPATQKRAAQVWDVSEGYLCDVLKGRRDVGPKLLEALGYEKRIGYAPIKK